MIDEWIEPANVQVRYRVTCVRRKKDHGNNVKIKFWSHPNSICAALENLGWQRLGNGEWICPYCVALERANKK